MIFTKAADGEREREGERERGEREGDGRGGGNSTSSEVRTGGFGAHTLPRLTRTIVIIISIIGRAGSILSSSTSGGAEVDQCVSPFHYSLERRSVPPDDASAQVIGSLDLIVR